MRDVLGPRTHLGYCTNVHAGLTVDEICANLTTHAAAVRQRVCPDGQLGVGLWLPAEAIARGTHADWEKLRHTLIDQDLYAFTLNGFPYGDFHAATVKHAVYQPDWTRPERLEYTLALAVRLAALTGGVESGISTLPIGWKAEFQSKARLEQAAAMLRTLAVRLHELHERGLHVHVDLEPEPGCVLETSADVVAFFERYLLHDPHAEHARRYLRVCHDICHAAVMGESQVEAFERYAAAGIEVGKVQVSSALEVDFDALTDDAARSAARAALAQFAEPRFLHQTTINTGQDAAADAAAAGFFEDLPAALAASPAALRGVWRTHFHVPIHLDAIGPLRTTRSQIPQALDAARRLSNCRAFEVETYAWTALPEDLRPANLAEGIAAELNSVLRPKGERT